MTNSFTHEPDGLFAITGDQIEVALRGSTDDIYRPQQSWGKAIFSQAFVIPSTWGGGRCYLVPGGSLVLGVSGPGGCLVVAGGTHHTGMHSCPLVTSETYLYNGLSGFRI